MKKLLIEKFLTYHRIRTEETIARLRHDPRVTPAVLAQNITFTRTYTANHTAAAERARKYRITSSAEKMIEALRPRPLLIEEYSLTLVDQIASGTRPLDPDIATPVLSMPDTPIWLELENAIFTGGDENGQHQEIAAIMFFSTDHEVDLQRSQPQSASARTMLEQVARQDGQDYQWPLYFIDQEGRPSDQYFYLEHAQSWQIRPGKPCPVEACTYSDIDDPTRTKPGNKTKVRHPCPFCATILAYWRSWLTTALLVVSGELAATETGEWPRSAERTTRKVQRHNSAKFDEVPVQHDYYMVSFDASVRKTRPANMENDPEQEKTPELRGSWVDAAREIDAESVVYVRQSFGISERHLDPARNSRWKQAQVVKVRSHERRVPMKITTAQKRITRVIASKYAQATPNE